MFLLKDWGDMSKSGKIRTSKSLPPPIKAIFKLVKFLKKNFGNKTLEVATWGEFSQENQLNFIKK